MKYFDAYLNIAKSPKETYIADFQELLTQQFDNASDVFDVKEEFPFASNKFQDVHVRINHAIDSITGEKRGDDYKTILFPDITHATGIGWYYQFSDNYWIVTASEIRVNLAASATVSRCNEVLKWQDSQGGIYEYPCSMLNKIQRPSDQEKSGQGGQIVPEGLITITVQLNENTNKVRPNQRFLFGNPNNWTAYKVRGSGVSNYNRQQTNDPMSSGTLELIVGADFINPDTDDLINGIADINKMNYVLTILNSNTTRNIGNKLQLSTLLTLNNTSIVKPLTWFSNNENVAIVDNNGLVTYVGAGETQIICQLKDNLNVTASIDVSTTPTPVTEYDLIVSPDENFVYEGDTKVFSVYLTLNGIQQSNVATFTLVPNTVPSKNYVYTVVDSNHFSIKNLKAFFTDVLTVNVFSFSQSKNIDINLRGSF